MDGSSATETKIGMKSTSRLSTSRLSKMQQYSKAPIGVFAENKLSDPRVSESEADWKIKVIRECHFISLCALLQ